MSLIEIHLSSGFSAKKVCHTKGGEYAGPCPSCGGKDRFRIKEDRFFCRQCGKHGDQITYLREFKGLSYTEACKYMGTRPAGSHRSRISGKEKELVFSPQPASLCSIAWREQIEGELGFLQTFMDDLSSDQGKKARAFLYSRGLKDESIKKANLGVNLFDRYPSRESFGLSAEVNEKGKAKTVFIPEGIVIPNIINGEIQRIRIRRTNPAEGSRYMVLAGSSMSPMILGSCETSVVVVESELDALLIHQEAADLVTVIALGSAFMKPDKEAHELLSQAEQILVALDADEAGAKAANAFWKREYGNKCKRWPTVRGKDPGEAYQQGLCIRAWIETGLSNTNYLEKYSGLPAEISDALDNVIPFPIDFIKDITEAQIERLAIMTENGRLSDQEALSIINSDQIWVREGGIKSQENCRS